MMEWVFLFYFFFLSFLLTCFSSVTGIFCILPALPDSFFFLKKTRQLIYRLLSGPFLLSPTKNFCCNQKSFKRSDIPEPSRIGHTVGDCAFRKIRSFSPASCMTINKAKALVRLKAQLENGKVKQVYYG